SHLRTSQNNNTYSFSLTDENGELIQLSGLNMNLTRSLYKKDPILNQIRNFMKLALLKQKIISSKKVMTTEGSSIVPASQINYEQHRFSHASYKFEPQF